MSKFIGPFKILARKLYLSILFDPLIDIIHGKSSLSKEPRQPRLFESRLNVEENGIIEIGSKTFGLTTFVEDDQIDHQLTFKVDPPPKHGQVERKGNQRIYLKGCRSLRRIFIF